MTLFQTALRNRYRYSSVKGLLTTEDLFSLPLTTSRSNQACLDDVAKSINRELKEAGEESFVDSKTTKQTELENKLEIVKAVIAVKQSENDARAYAARKQQRRAQIMDILATKETEELQSKSRDELLKELESLD